MEVVQACILRQENMLAKGMCLARKAREKEDFYLVATSVVFFFFFFN